ncbi:MAG: hypothetical protein WEC37_03975, partial [Anaerolineales bacterium]
MNKDFRPRLIAASTLVALLLSLAMPLAALAQEGDTSTPTLESSPTETASPENSPTPEASATEVPSETPTLEISPTDTETAVSETPTETPSETSTPTDTGIVTETLTPTVTPTLGIPLESSAFSTSDVIWCPATLAVPVESAPCIGPFNELLDLFNALDSPAEPSVDGIIWVGETYGGTDDVIFNGSLLPLMTTHKITFKGGWIAVGGTIGGTASPVGHKLQVINWTKDSVMTDLAVDADNPGIGLRITTSGSIFTTRVSSSSADGLGAEFSTFGIGNVTVNTGTFNSNGSTGLTVNSDGNIVLSGVTSNL